MAILTWQNVPIPDVGRTRQEGIRTAADMLGRAVAGATAGVGQVQAIQDSRRAAETAAADRFVLEKMLSTQDPGAYQQMRADGSLVGPAADRVSNSALLAAEARGDQLHARDRTLTREQELQSAEKVWDKAVPHATSDPARFQSIMAEAKFTNAEDSAAFAKRGRELYVDPETGRVARDRAKKEEQTLAVSQLVDRIIGVGGQAPERAATILGEHPDPVERQMVIDRLNQLKYPVGDIYSTAPATSGDPGPGVIVDGAESALTRRFGNNTALGMAKAGPDNPPPGSPEWSEKNSGRMPTMGDEIEWSRAYVLPASEAQRGKGKGTTAVGPAQIVSTTREDFIKRHGQKLFGTTDPHKVPFTLENEEKLAEKIYQEQKAGAWEATQSYAGLRDLSAFKGKSFQDAKPLLYYIDGGVAPGSYASKAKQIEATLQERTLALPEGAKVILNARAGAGLDSNGAAQELVKVLGKETRPGEARELVEETVRKAKEAGTVITHAEAAGLILNSLEDDSSMPWSWSSLRDDLSLKTSKLTQDAKDLGNAREYLKTYEKDMEKLQKLKELQEQYKKDAKTAESALSLARRSPDAGESAINAFRKWQATSDQIARMVASKAGNAVEKELVDQARPAPVAEPDIDLADPVGQADRLLNKAAGPARAPPSRNPLL